MPTGKILKWMIVASAITGATIIHFLSLLTN
jgi:hypothetical protein